MRSENEKCVAITNFLSGLGVELNKCLFTNGCLFTFDSSTIKRDCRVFFLGYSFRHSLFSIRGNQNQKKVSPNQTSNGARKHILFCLSGRFVYGKPNVYYFFSSSFTKLWANWFRIGIISHTLIVLLKSSEKFIDDLMMCVIHTVYSNAYGSLRV